MTFQCIRNADDAALRYAGVRGDSLFDRASTKAVSGDVDYLRSSGLSIARSGWRLSHETCLGSKVLLKRVLQLIRGYEQGYNDS